MKMMRFTMIAALLYSILAGVAFAVHDKGELVDIPLEWKPTDAISSYSAVDLTAFQKVTFQVRPFTDIRKKSGEIGRNVEKRQGEQEHPVTTRDNVALWLTDRVSQTLRDFDVDVAKENGTLILEGDVVKFYVTESSSYDAEVGLKIRLRSKTDAVLWEGMVSSSASRFGRSYQAENYYEGLSNATIGAVHALLRNEKFVQAVQKNR